MRLGLIALLLTAGTAVSAPGVTSPGRVTALAMDGKHVAFASGTSPGDCDRIRVWNVSTGSVARLGRTTHCEETSTGRGIAALAIAGTRVLWLHYVGGNTREWSLFTATTTSPRPKRLRFVARDVDDAPPIVLGEGHHYARHGDALPYAVDREVVVLDANGRRLASWSEPSRVTAIAGTGVAVAVATADGEVSVREDMDWTQPTDSWGGSPAARAVFFAGVGVVTQRGRIVELHGSFPHERTLPAGATLRDAYGFKAVYLVRGRVKLLDLASGKTRDLGAGTDAQLEYSTVAVASGRVVGVFRIT